MAANNTILNGVFKFLPVGLLYLSPAYRNSRKLKGTWQYKCILRTGIFVDMHPDGIDRNAHGGECSIEIERRYIVTKISIKGTRTWAANIDKNGNKNDHYKLNEIRRWETNDAAFITDSRIMYKYSIDDALAGITLLDLNYNSNTGKISPIGEFYYLPDENSVQRKINTSGSLFNRMLATKDKPISQIALKSIGEVTLYR
jgi:hypothetical protein